MHEPHHRPAPRITPGRERLCRWSGRVVVVVGLAAVAAAAWAHASWAGEVVGIAAALAAAGTIEAIRRMEIQDHRVWVHVLIHVILGAILFAFFLPIAAHVGDWGTE